MPGDLNRESEESKQPAEEVELELSAERKFTKMHPKMRERLRRRTEVAGSKSPASDNLSIPESGRPVVRRASSKVDEQDKLSSGAVTKSG